MITLRILRLWTLIMNKNNKSDDMMIKQTIPAFNNVKPKPKDLYFVYFNQDKILDVRCGRLIM